MLQEYIGQIYNVEGVIIVLHKKVVMICKYRLLVKYSEGKEDSEGGDIYSIRKTGVGIFIIFLLDPIHVSHRNRTIKLDDFHDLPMTKKC